MTHSRGLLLAAAVTFAMPSLVPAAERGAALYAEHCALCHDAAGTGVPGFGPPLNYTTRNSAGALGGNLNFVAAKYLSQGACAGGACPSRAPER